MFVGVSPSPSTTRTIPPPPPPSQPYDASSYMASDPSVMYNPQAYGYSNAAPSPQDPSAAAATMMAMNPYMMSPAAWAAMMATYYSSYNYGASYGQGANNYNGGYSNPNMNIPLAMNVQQPSQPSTLVAAPQEPAAPLPEETPAAPPQ